MGWTLIKRSRYVGHNFLLTSVIDELIEENKNGKGSEVAMSILNYWLARV